MSAWRDNGGYTEVLQPKPQSLNGNFRWVEIDTSQTQEKVQGEILKHLFNIGCTTHLEATNAMMFTNADRIKLQEAADRNPYDI